MLVPMSQALLLHMPLKLLHMSAPVCFMRAEAETMTELEACCVNALSEDDVQACMQMYEEGQDAEEEDAPLSERAASMISREHDSPTELEACVVNALSEDDVQACMQMYEEAEDVVEEAPDRQASLSHLRASYSSQSPPMRDAAVVAAKARAASTISHEHDSPTELEACVVNALSEDDVQACMQMYEDAEE